MTYELPEQLQIRDSSNMGEVKNIHGKVIAAFDGELRAILIATSEMSLIEADFENAVLEGFHFDDLDLRGACFRGADLYWGNFFLANLEGANCERASFRGADLKCCNLRNADLRGADFSRDNLNGATQLGGAILSGADLSGANVSGADLRGAIYDRTTKFPDRFDPVALGLVLQERTEPEGMD